MQAVNPYIAGSPVTGSEMFFGREDVFDFVRQALTGRHRDNVIILYGERRTGKTSTLYQMTRHLDARYLCVFIDLHALALDGLPGALWELASSITRTLYRTYEIKLTSPAREAFAVDARGYFENEFLNQVWAALGDRHLLLMLDEAIRLQEQVQVGKLEAAIFEYLRHLMQHYDRLNFLFSLGSGLEELTREYAFLFNVGLYKKITFLDRDAAVALCTLPVQEFYQVEPLAIERIVQITAGHPYFTQLLCHCLFNHWLHAQTDRVTVSDVDAILDEVVERGLPVLKQVWEESTAAEKAVMAGAVVAMGPTHQPVSMTEIGQALARGNIRMPVDEMARAVKSLLAREVLQGRDRYSLSVDLQRHWVERYERVEWVREEIADAIRRWTLFQPPPLSPPARTVPHPPLPLTSRSTPRHRLSWLTLALGGAMLGLVLLVAAIALSNSAAQRAWLVAPPTLDASGPLTATLAPISRTKAPRPTMALPSPTATFGSGSRIVFTNGTPGCSSIGLLDLSTGDAKTFNPSPNNEEPSWAPDGVHFVASTGDCNNDRYYLTVITIQDSTSTRVKTNCDKSIDTTWGSDNRIYFACGPKSDNGELLAVNSDGSELSGLGLSGRRPTLSPDGKYLAYMRNEKAGWRIWVARVNANGKPSDMVRLPFPQVLGGVSARQPRWSSDGTRLFFNVTDKSSQTAIALATVELATKNTNVAFITPGTTTPFIRPACGRNNVCIAGGVTGGLWLLEDVNGTLAPRRQLTSGEEFGADVYP